MIKAPNFKIPFEYISLFCCCLFFGVGFLYGQSKYNIALQAEKKFWKGMHLAYNATVGIKPGDYTKLLNPDHRPKAHD